MLPVQAPPPHFLAVLSTSAPNAERVGIYGGSFDPIHHGHLILGRDAVESLRLTRLIFIPAAVSPHKLARQPGAPGAARLAMLAAAVENEPAFEVDDCELRRAGPSYTIDTIESLRARFPAGSEFLYLIGGDNVAALPTWHRIAELRELVTFVVFERGTAAPAAGETSFPTLARRVDISATEIRKRVASAQSIRYLLPERVRELIAVESLYRSPEPGVPSSPLKN